MKTVCVITGGGSGMGLAAAKCMPKEKIIVVAGRTAAKLDRAVEELQALGYEAYAKTCDVSIRSKVRDLAEYAAGLGEIRNVINSAGLSPSMAGPEQLGFALATVADERNGYLVGVDVLCDGGSASGKKFVR